MNGERTEYVWDGMNMTYEHGTVTDHTYAYDITGVHMSGGDVYIKDGHGNIIGSHGTTTGSADVYYDAFGNLIYESEQTTPFGYCGEYRDEESGLIYLRNRYYDSNTGRFITEDQHWSINNMIYGDNQKAEKVSIVDDEKTYYDENDNILKVEKNNINAIDLPIHMDSDMKYDNKIQFYQTERRPNSEAIAQSTNLYIYALNNPVKYIDYNGEEASGLGVTAYVAFGIRIDVQGYYVWDDDGNKGIILSAGGGGGTPNAGVSGTAFTNKSADTIFDLEGMSVTVGGGVSYFGADVNGNLGGGSVSGGISALPAELHSTVTFGKILFSWR